MRPTQRGWAAIGAAIGAVVVAWVFGTRALNAVAVTAVVALAVGAVQLRLADFPSVERSMSPSGFVGESRTVSIAVDGTRGTIVRVRDHHPDALEATGATFDGTLPIETTYDVTLAGRGRHAIGPADVRQRDALGLLQRSDPIGDLTSVLVYPAVYDVAGSNALAAIVDRSRTPDRQEIDRLREYVPGDPLRDVAWRASAKRPQEFVVVEYAGRETDGTVDIALSATWDGIDEVASAAASVGLFLLEAGLDVGLVAPDDRIEPASGHGHRGALLASLAEIGPGTIDERAWADADVRIVADHHGATVDVGTRAVAFETIRTGDRTVAVPETAPDTDRPDRVEVSTA